MTLCLCLSIVPRLPIALRPSIAPTALCLSVCLLPLFCPLPFPVPCASRCPLCPHCPLPFNAYPLPSVSPLPSAVQCLAIALCRLLPSRTQARQTYRGSKFSMKLQALGPPPHHTGLTACLAASHGAMLSMTLTVGHFLMLKQQHYAKQTARLRALSTSAAAVTPSPYLLLYMCLGKHSASCSVSVSDVFVSYTQVVTV